jgi:glycosyltransferase involved in cell wall biosynthesis
MHRIPLQRGSRRPWHELATLLAIDKVIRTVGPHLIHFITMKPIIYGGPLARLRKISSVNSVTGLGYLWLSGDQRRGMADFLLNGLLRFGCKHPRASLIFQNPDDQAEFIQRDLCSKEQCHVIRGSGVDTDLFKPHSPPAEPPVVMLASRLLWDKGVGEFVDAARILKKRGTAARFVLVGGEDPNPSSIPKRTLEAWVAEGVIEWWGWRSDMPAVLAQAHIACLPSYREGLPKSLLEAAACGLPVVTTDVAGCREVVQHGVNGLLVAAKDSQALANALAQLVRDPELCRTMGRAGRKLVEREYSIEIVVHETLVLYAAILTRS